MRFKRISVAKTVIEGAEHVDHDYVVVWMLPHHGLYPSKEIALAVAAAHQCDDSGIKQLMYKRLYL